MVKYKSYGTLNKTTYFLSVFCEVAVVQQRTEAQAAVVQDVLMDEFNRLWLCSAEQEDGGCSAEGPGQDGAAHSGGQGGQ